MARARTPQKDLLTRLADAGEHAIKSLADAPGADRFLGSVNALKERLDELQKRVAGVLPVRVDVPRAGSSYKFVRPLVLDEETKVTFSYKMSEKKNR